jgi:homoaconitate hydratase
LKSLLAPTELTSTVSFFFFSNEPVFKTNHILTTTGAGRGIGHQIIIEEGYAWPNTLMVASDSHSNMYGAVNCVGTPVVRTDAASIFATGRTWFQVPPIAKITFTGIMPPGVTGKDVIIALCGLINKDEVLNHCIEFTGSEETLRSIPVDHRLSISNMTTEWGALSGLFPLDSVLVSWLRAKATLSAMFDGGKGRFTHERIDELLQNQLHADPGATYAKSLYLNLSTLSPFVSGPNTPKVATPLKDLEEQKIPLNKAYIVSCTNSRASDLHSAAQVFREAATEDGVIPKVAAGVELYIAAASLPEQRIAEEAGDWQVLLDAGAHALVSGCGPCIGLGVGLLEPGDVGISASNRNFPGRMGDKTAKAYLSSPEVVAASALKGYIAGPGWYQKPEGVEKVIIGEGSGNFEADKAMSVEAALDKLLSEAESMISGAEKDLNSSSATPTDEAEDTLTDVLPGFPEKVEGELIFCDFDNINTDGIYPGIFFLPLPKIHML